MGSDRTKSWHQSHEGSSPRRPNTATRSLHQSAVAGCTWINTALTLGRLTDRSSWLSSLAMDPHPAHRTSSSFVDLERTSHVIAGTAARSAA